MLRAFWRATIRKRRIAFAAREPGGDTASLIKEPDDAEIPGE
jgi:hypothetical protein